MKRINDADYDPSNAYHYRCIDCQQKYEGMPGAAISVKYDWVGSQLMMIYHCGNCGGRVIIREIRNEQGRT